MRGGRVTRRDLLRFGGMAATGSALAACGAQTPQVVEKIVEQTVIVKETVVGAPEATYEQGELNILVCCSGPDEQAAKEEFNQRFAAGRSGVKVTLEPMPAGQSYFEKLQTVIAAGTAPDIYDMWEGYVQPYAKNGALMNLDPFMESDNVLKKADFWEGLLPGATWQGNMYALIFGVMPGPVSIFYNKKLFDAAGAAYPVSDWTWDQMRDAARALTVGADTEEPSQYGLTFDLWFVPWLYWIWSNGGDVFNADETKCLANEAPAYEALQYWADLVVQDRSAPSPSMQTAMQGSVNMFKTDLVAMYLGNCWDLVTLDEARTQGLEWGACLAPIANNGNRTFYLHQWCWGIWTGTKVPNLAWEYCRDFAVDETMITTFNTIQKAVPGVRRMLHTFLTPETEALGWAGVVDILGDTSKVRYPGAGDKWDKISGMLQAEIDLVYSGDKSAKDAMATAAPKVDEELARA